MKNLIILSGAMGVGKSAIAKELNNQLNKSIWLDGDWCWMQGGDWNFCQENKEMVVDNINYLLKSFLKNSNFENIIFSWVLHLPEIWDLILKSLKEYDFNLHKFSIVCNEEILKERMTKRFNSEEKNTNDLNSQISSAIQIMKLYEKLDTIKIDSSHKKPIELVNEITKYLK